MNERPSILSPSESGINPDIEYKITNEGIKSFLAGPYVKGIGKVFAAKIAERFGSEILSPQFDLKGKLAEIPGLGASKINEIAESFGNLKLPASHYAFLYSAGLSDVDVDKIVSHYRKKTVEAILEDPYDMVENVWKMSFFSADRLGALLHIDPADPRRLRGAFLTAVKFYAERGNMFATEEQALKTASNIAGVAEELIRRQIPELVEDHRIVASRDGYYLPVYFEAEKEAAEKIGELMAAKQPDDYLIELPSTDIQGNPLNEEQMNAVAAVLKNPVSIITGGPGTGKTTLIRALTRMFADLDKKVILAAPTGRAAKRMADLSGADASTIHRLLGYRQGRGYIHKSLDADVLIIDEASMLEQVLFNHLLQAMKGGAKVVLVGDTDQLPAIGAGDVLNQMIRSEKIPVVRLTENFRQKEGSAIASSAEEIRKGGVPAKLPKGDFLTIEAEGVEAAKAQILRLVTHDIPDIYKIAPKDIQVVTPQQEGPLGSKRLNEFLQEAVNKEAPEIKLVSRRFRLGDRVMQISNDSQRNVYNGETGWISALNPERGELEVTFGDDKKIIYGKSRLRDLTLAYATTVHKLQGSETDYMVLLMSMAHRPMLYRNLLYTGVSRARKLCVVLGEEKALQLAVGNEDAAIRNSAFKDMLREEIGMWLLLLCGGSIFC